MSHLNFILKQKLINILLCFNYTYIYKTKFTIKTNTITFKKLFLVFIKISFYIFINFNNTFIN